MHFTILRVTGSKIRCTIRCEVAQSTIYWERQRERERERERDREGHNQNVK